MRGLQRHSIRFWGLLVLLLTGSGSLAADVIFLVDGRILIGQLQGPVEGGVGYQVLGAPVTLTLAQIKKTEKTLTSLAELGVEVLLKDGSVLRGKIVDFDEDVGLFIDIGFGVLTAPTQAVDTIVDAQQRRSFSGASAQFRAGGGAYLPFLLGDHFGPSWTSSLGAIWAYPSVRGLFLGVTTSFSGAEYLSNDTASYSFLSIGPVAELRYLEWGSTEGLLRIFTPFVTLTGGGTYVSLTDPSLSQSRQNSLTGFVELAGGTDIAVVPGWALRLDAYSSMILQQGTPWIVGGARLWVCYEY